jgi:hypothetical protein
MQDASPTTTCHCQARRTQSGATQIAGGHGLDTGNRGEWSPISRAYNVRQVKWLDEPKLHAARRIGLNRNYQRSSAFNRTIAAE